MNSSSEFGKRKNSFVSFAIIDDAVSSSEIHARNCNVRPRKRAHENEPKWSEK